VGIGEFVSSSSRTESGRLQGVSWLLTGWIGSVLIVVSIERSK